MFEYNPSDAELDAAAMAYIYGEGDFEDLPWTVARVIPSPADHPDNDPCRPVRALQSDEEWAAEFAELHELADRVEAGFGWLAVNAPDQVGVFLGREDEAAA